MQLFKRFKRSLQKVFLGKGVQKICTKFTWEHQRLSEISIKLLCNFIEITLRHGCSPVNLLNIFRTPFPTKTFGGLLLKIICGQLLLATTFTFFNWFVSRFSSEHFMRRKNSSIFFHATLQALTHFILLVSFYTTWKHQKTPGFLYFQREYKNCFQDSKSLQKRWRNILDQKSSLLLWDGSKRLHGK